MQVIGDREPLDDPAVTHGACDPCVERALAEWAELVGEAGMAMAGAGGTSQFAAGGG